MEKIVKKWFGKVDEAGRLKLFQEKLFKEHVHSFQNSFIELVLEKRRRSVSLNAWYWGCILPLISEHTGHSLDWLHEFFKQEFVGKQQKVRVFDTDVVLSESSSKLNTTEFSEFCEKVRKFAREKLGVIIPDPERKNNNE